MQIVDTQSTLEEFSKRDIHLEVLNLVKTGKEAVVYRVQDQEDGQTMALKIYKSHELRSFKQNYQYLAGNHIVSRTLRQAVRKKTKLGRDYIQSTWVEREFRILRQLNALHANVPTVYSHITNAMLFEYLGDDSPAPKLCEVKLGADTARATFELLLDNIELFLRAGFVHGDLSAFNVLWWQEQPYVIDFPQAVDIIKNVNSWELLVRDIENISSYFREYIEIDDQMVEARFEAYRPLLVANGSYV